MYNIQNSWNQESGEVRLKARDKYGRCMKFGTLFDTTVVFVWMEHCVSKLMVLHED